MNKFFLISVASAALAFPALAAPVGLPFSFDADGKHFEAARVETPNGAVFTGVDSQRNRFRLEVVGRHVTGYYGDGPVSYDMPAPLARQERIALK